MNIAATHEALVERIDCGVVRPCVGAPCVGWVHDGLNRDDFTLLENLNQGILHASNGENLCPAKSKN